MNAERLKDLKAQEATLENEIQAIERMVSVKYKHLDSVRAEIAFEEWGVRVGYIVTDRRGIDYKVTSADFSFSTPWLKGHKRTKDGWSKKEQNVYGWTNPRPEQPVEQTMGENLKG